MLKELNKEHSGFAITLEVLATLFMFTVFMSIILYTIRTMNVQRYMNTILTSTASSVSRWGGYNTQAYKNNVNSTENLLQTAQKQLEVVAPLADWGSIITCDTPSITGNNQYITVKISYHLPPVFQDMSKVTALSGDQYDMYNKTNNLSMSISIKSIMKYGNLL